MATITTINATDLVSASRAVINTNFANLNTDKVDGAAALTTAGRLLEVASSGVATQTSFASSAVLLSTGSYADPAWLTSLATSKLSGTVADANLASTAVTPAAYGAAGSVATFTVDAKGRITAAASVAVAIAASQVTSGTLDNARTTAASTNTVSAIVARDASGNFAAGTITATFSGNLTGNVTGNASGTAATITGALALANTPLTTRGDLLVATTATPILGRLAKGTQYQVLTGGATDPTWGAVDLSQATAITGTLPVGNGGTGATTLAGAGIVVGSASLTTANAIPIVASAGVLGQSDVMLASGIFSRAGTVGLSATGSNIITFSTVGSEAARITTGQNLVVGTTIALAKLSTVTTSLAAVPTLGTSTGAQFAVLGDGAAYGAIHGVLTSGQSFIQAGRTDSTATAYGLLLQPVGGNVLIGTTTDDGSSKLQVDSTGVAAKFGADFTSTGQSRSIKIGNTAQIVAYYTAGNSYDIGFQTYVAGFNENFRLTGIGGNTLVGGSTEGNYRLDVQSSGSTGTMRVYDQTAVTGSSTLVVRAGAGQSTTALQQWRQSNDALGWYISADAKEIVAGSDFIGYIRARGGSGSSSRIDFSPAASFVRGSTGSTPHLRTGATFAPVGGSVVFADLELAPTINQTGGATGIARGLYINPTVTAAADWRAIEVVTGNAIFASGTVIASATAVPTLANSQFTFHLASNTELVVTAKGSDGTLRSVALTLAP